MKARADARRSQPGVDARSPGGRLGLLQWRGLARLALAVLVAMIGFLALHALSREVSFGSLRSALETTTRGEVALSLLFTCCSFAALALYDVIAVRVAAPGQLPTWLAALTRAAGYAVSNMLGFALVTGGALRARVYGSRGLDMNAVGGVLATSWLTFWMGVAVAAGAVLLLDPSGLVTRFGLPAAIDRVLGAALIAPVLGLFAWTATGQRVLAVGSFRLRLPGLRVALLQTFVALLDVGTAALALYVLLPADLSVGPATFFAAYIAAIVVGLISHAPGGLGTFEATLIAALGLSGRPDVLAALIVYRLIYYVLPFVVTAFVVAILWGRANRDAARARAVWAGEAIGPLVPPLAAGISLLAGLVLLFSGSLPLERPRAQALEALAPLAVVESSHLLGSALGVVLIVLSQGLASRQFHAWALAMGALALGVAASLFRGLDWEGAGLLVLAMAVLGAFRSAFYRHGGEPLRLTWAWTLGAGLLVAASVWLGLLSYRHVEYANDLWWHFAWTGEASRFLRGSVAAAVALAGLGAASLLASPRREGAPEPIPDAVRRLVLESRDTEANMALLGDKRFLLSPAGDAFLMYRATRAAMIVKSDPVGDEREGAKLAWELLERADRAGLIPAFYGVGTRYLPTYLDMGLSILKIGEVGRVNLAKFDLDGQRRRDFRHARSRAGREGMTFAIVPASEVPAVMDEIRRVSDLWLQEKQGEEKSFALGKFDPAYLVNFDHAVMRAADGRIMAFANLWRGSEKHELSLDLMRHDPSAPKVTMDAFFAEIMLWGKAENYRWFNLGAAPFSGMSDYRLSTRWNRLGAFVYRHGEDVYHFKGLRAFKEKFDPVWTPNYLACPGGLASARVLLEVNRLLSGGVRGLLR